MKIFDFGKKKREKQRKEKYLELNALFRTKHDFVIKWYRKKYCPTTLDPTTKEGFQYLLRIKSFFSYRYGELPKSFNEFASVNYGFDPTFDHFPVEKLQALYDEIETAFPEPFLLKKRKEKLNKLNEKI